MPTVNIHEAKTHLSRLLDEVVAGDDVVIAKAGKPIARLIPFVSPSKKRKLGILAGKLNVPVDFDAPLPEEVLASFEGQ
jgi:prevent-host-death family protein